MNTAHPKKTVNARIGLSCCLLLLVGCMSGCASWTNPVANGIPVRLLGPELLAESKEAMVDIPWGLLKRTPPEEVIIEPEDVLGVYIPELLGSETVLPPVRLPDSAGVPPALGFPIPVHTDGTIPLPYIPDPKVAGLTVEQAQAEILAAYTKTDKILAENGSVMLSMIRPRHVRVLVVREDALGSRGRQFQQSHRGFLAAPLTNFNSSQQGAGFDLTLPATQADVLTALSQTGGLPGLDAKSEIKIYRKASQGDGDDGIETNRARASEPELIALKVKKGEKPTLTERDIILDDGDILVVETREPEHYYTAGLMFNQEVPLPFDYDLNVVEAVSRVGGPMLNGGFGGANLNGNIVNAGIGNPSPSLLTILRKTPNGQQIAIRVDLFEALRDPRENILIKDGDYLVMQETTGESFARYLSNVLNFSGSGAVSRVNGVTTRSSALGGSVGPLP